MSDESSFEFSGQMDIGMVADYLENLSRYVRTSHVHMAMGADSIDLHLSPEVKMEISAKMKGEKQKGSLEVEISWKRPPHFDEPLRIQAAEEPQPPESGEGQEEHASTGGLLIGQGSDPAEPPPSAQPYQ